MKYVLFSTTFVLALSGWPPTSGAWDSRCRDKFTGEECADGYIKPRSPWAPVDPDQPNPFEHATLFRLGLLELAMPQEFLGPFDLVVFTDDKLLMAEEELPEDLYSLIPVLRGASRQAIRTRTIWEMAQLPDHSYSLWDWASGNETCPPDGPEVSPSTAQACHTFKTHMGLLNSNHFVPQSQRWYGYIHGLAVGRARECRTLYESIPEDQVERFELYVKACEKEALVIEALAQHYLQDAWSMGHMWERWGGADRIDWNNRTTLGAVIAAISGTIHGARAILRDYLPNQAANGGLADRMCGPSIETRYHDALTGEISFGAGDEFLEEAIIQTRFVPPTDTYPGIPDFALEAYGGQRAAMLSCIVDGIQEVYSETAQLHGPIGAPITPARDVNGPSCWGQRVPNRTLAAGFGLDLPTPFNQVPVPNGPEIVAGLLPWVYAHFIPVDLPELGEAESERLQADVSEAAGRAFYGAIQAPDSTTMASGGLNALAGIKPNSGYLHGGPATKPASYADPDLPWNTSSNGSDALPKMYLSLTFSDAHAADRCGDFTQADLELYKSEYARWRDEGDSSRSEVALDQCIQMVGPHVRVGTGPADRDLDREALCGFVSSTSPFVYLDPLFAGETTDPLQLAANWCVFEACEDPSDPTSCSSDGSAETGTVSIFISPPPGIPLSAFANFPPTTAYTITCDGGFRSEGEITLNIAAARYEVFDVSLPAARCEFRASYSFCEAIKVFSVPADQTTVVDFIAACDDASAKEATCQAECDSQGCPVCTGWEYASHGFVYWYTGCSPTGGQCKQVCEPGASGDCVADCLAGGPTCGLALDNCYVIPSQPWILACEEEPPAP